MPAFSLLTPCSPASIVVCILCCRSELALTSAILPRISLVIFARPATALALLAV
jgi:hypothetical protein